MYLRVPHSLQDLADGDLIRRFKRGDDDALEVLLRRHSDDLYRFCCHLVPNHQDAEDIFQESLMRAIDRVDSLQSGSAFRRWLFRIARNLSVDSFRSRRRTCSLVNEDIAPLPVQEAGPQDRIEVGEEHHEVAEAFSKLAERHQRVLVLREVERLSYADIARRLNVSESAVETLLFRARKRLREEYAKREDTVPGLAFLAWIRTLGGRLSTPLLGGTHIAAKLAVTGALLGGVAAISTGNLPVAHLLDGKTKTYARSTVHRQAQSRTRDSGAALNYADLGKRMSLSAGSSAGRRRDPQGLKRPPRGEHLARPSAASASIRKGARAARTGSRLLRSVGTVARPVNQAVSRSNHSSLAVAKRVGVSRVGSPMSPGRRGTVDSKGSRARNVLSPLTYSAAVSESKPARGIRDLPARGGSRSLKLAHAASRQLSARANPSPGNGLPPGQVKKTGAASSPLRQPPDSRAHVPLQSQGAQQTNRQGQAGQKPLSAKNDQAPKGKSKR